MILCVEKVDILGWIKLKAGFDLITSSVGSLRDGNRVSYFFMLMDNEVPMDTYYALQYTEKWV